MIIPELITSDQDKVRFIYRELELLRLEHNEKGRYFREGKLSEKEFRDYQRGEFNDKINRMFAILNPIKEKLGMFAIKESLESYKLLLKEQGKSETKWDSIINLNQI